MSVTTTTNPISTSVSILADYEIHHSEQRNPVPNPHPAPEFHYLPTSWSVEHRRVPEYRPINRHLDLNERPAGSNLVEGVFIAVMLHGVWINAVGQA